LLPVTSNSACSDANPQEKKKKENQTEEGRRKQIKKKAANQLCKYLTLLTSSRSYKHKPSTVVLHQIIIPT
jgi:hypothetical protein